MKKLQLTLSVLFITILVGCKSEAKKEAADMVFTNGKVYTVTDAQPWAEAVAIKGDKIVFVGSTIDAEAYIGDNTETTDLAGKMMLPGFVSGHDHLVASNWTKAGVNLFPAKNKEEYLALIKAYADANPDEEFIYGYGWNYTSYGSERPTAAELDAVVPNQKAILFDFTIHDAWLNSKMLEAGNITKETEDKQPGFSYWVRDDAGNPTGNSVELSWMDAYISAGAWDKDVLLVNSQKELYDNAASQGWTSVLNIGLVTPNISTFEQYIEDNDYAMKLLKDLNDKGELKLRTFAHYLFKNGNIPVEDIIAEAKKFQATYNSDMIRMQGIKIHPEANWGTHTSLMLEPYTDRPDYAGIDGVSPEIVQDMIVKANEQGLDVSIHADGSATIRTTIDAIEFSKKAGHADARNSLQHFAVVHPDDMKRAGELDIPVNLTPIWRTDWGNTYALAQDKLGQERTENYYQQIKTAFDIGLKVSISADVPSTPSNEAGALFLIESAMTRMNPNDPDSKPFPPASQAITLEQGIKGVTVFPAWQVRMEDKIGTIEVGKYADLVILEKNLFDVQSNEIAKVKVVSTMMNGKYTHKSN
ncbi:amidohydrolase [Algibacter mikhailovii]|uniref:Amidohydrolase n=1 Tax=Algibacter mikhailovii TaxID=425498 RepID=A0A918QWK8_9FLAO|nr:amidohydrolase [Algibacter mikhailovii]GGZ71798.1 putative amidohydrolase [Algibacter mikhailovii]